MSVTNVNERVSTDSSPLRWALSGRILARNAVWNFGGMAAPLVVAIFVVPLLIAGMGKERFGLLGIIWIGIGYFSLFDMGLGQALTKLVAERLGRNQAADLPEIMWTALWLVSGLGIVGMIVGVLLAKPLVFHLLNVPAALQSEGVLGFQLLAASIPVVIATSALVGILAAHQQFAMIAAVRIPLGIMTFLGPLISLQFTPSLVGATATMVVSRVIAFAVYYACAARVSPSLNHPMKLSRACVRPLLSFGGWLTVANIVGPLMVYVDRFYVGATLGMTAVAHYATPYDMLFRAQVLPIAAMGVLFPALTTANESERWRLPRLYDKAVRILFFMMLPLMGGAFLLAPEGLQFWLGDDFRIAATPAVRWIALGWIINTLARPSAIVLQSVGRPDLPVKVLFVEIVPYAIALWVLTLKYGITGTAAAWFLRIAVDTIVLTEIVRRKIPDVAAVSKWTHKVVAGLLVGFLLSSFTDSLIIRGLLFFALVILSGIFLQKLLKPWRQFGRTNLVAPTESIST
jgi:O-antigen/teichoic acid export membrane protein